MKKIKIFSLMLCCLMLASCSKSPEQQKFEKTTKYVDAGGEAFLYTNTKGIEKFVNEKVPATVRILTKNSNGEQDKMISAAVNSLLKLFNVKAFQAFAASSVDCGDNLYVHKQFLLIDKNEQSIFVNPTAKNEPVDWMNLPADTRFAFKGNVNFSHVWTMIKNEFNSNHPLYKDLASVLENQKVNASLKDFNGEVEFLLTGDSLRNAAFSLVIPDASGKFLELAQDGLKHRLINNKAEFPIGRLMKLTIEFKENKMFLYSKRAGETAANKKLADLPQYQKFAKVLPKTGCGYVVADLPQSVYNQIKAYFNNEGKVCELIDLYLKPISAVAISTVEKDGCLTVSASNFSVAQVQQVASFVGAASPATGFAVILPALQKARSKAQLINCTSTIKQLATAISFYAADHNDVLPSNMKDLVKEAYVSPFVLKDLIYLGPYEKTKISTIKYPSKYIIGVCNRQNHSSKNMAVLFLDGHVENHVPENLSTLAYLKMKYHLNQADSVRIALRLAEAKK